MYSPKISEDLVPQLYRRAKDRKIPMTRLVDGMIRTALATNNLPENKSNETPLSFYIRESEPPRVA